MAFFRTHQLVERPWRIRTRATWCRGRTEIRRTRRSRPELSTWTSTCRCLARFAEKPRRRSALGPVPVSGRTAPRSAGTECARPPSWRRCPAAFREFGPASSSPPVPRPSPGWPFSGRLEAGRIWNCRCRRICRTCRITWSVSKTSAATRRGHGWPETFSISREFFRFRLFFPQTIFWSTSTFRTSRRPDRRRDLQEQQEEHHRHRLHLEDPAMGSKNGRNGIEAEVGGGRSSSKK